MTIGSSKNTRTLLSGLTMLFAACNANAAVEKPRAVIGKAGHALLQTHCERCHGMEKQKGNFRIDDLSTDIADLPTAERWQKILNALNSGEMPPEDEKQPSKKLKADLLDELSNAMVIARQLLADQNGTITMRRLNRREYRNTLRELLGVTVDVSELPSDTGGKLFDTVGANLFSPATNLNSTRPSDAMHWTRLFNLSRLLVPRKHSATSPKKRSRFS